MIGDARDLLADALELIGDDATMRQEFIGHGPPFFLPHAVEVLQGVFQRFLDGDHFGVGGRPSTPGSGATPGSASTWPSK